MKNLAPNEVHPPQLSQVNINQSWSCTNLQALLQLNKHLGVLVQTAVDLTAVRL